VLATILLIAAGARAADDLVLADFEAADYGGWQATGEAFGAGPARGTLAGQMAVSGFDGQGLVNTFFRGDGTTGKLTSPAFRIDRKYVQFLLGGGNHPGQTCINLLVDGKEARTACCPAEGGSEHLEPHAWDVSDLLGKQAVIEIVDAHTGGWGHVNVDQIVLTDRKLPGWQTNPRRDLVAAKRYLHLPIKNGAPRHRMTVLVDGRQQRAFDIELADAEPDWWAFLEIGPWQGQTLTLTVDRLREDSRALALVEQADDVPAAGELYRERLRPQFHFSARRGWLNDPNGLVFDGGVYHLFFQHNPYGWNWGNMHWGHATSTDLVHWSEQPIAIYPDALGTAFSGSAVVDAGNTAGFQTGSEAPLVCIYTAAGEKFSQCLVYSNDRGRTWTKYAGNPVIEQIVPGNRDPKVFWHEPTARWVMALYLDKNDFALFASKDLKSWQRLSEVRVPGTIECPEMFSLEVAGRAGQAHWIFYGANGGYLVGGFDGKTFTPTSGPHALHHGNCFYASQTFSNVPVADGRRILIPWGQVALEGMPFNQMLGLPVVLSLHETAEGPRLFVDPVRELEGLRRASKSFPAGALEPGVNPLAGVSAELAELVVAFRPGEAKQVAFDLRGVEVVYDVARGELSCLGKQAKLSPIAGTVRLRFFVDRASIDIFGGDGAVYMPMGKSLAPASRSFSVTARAGTASIETLELHELQSAWKPAPGR
jgi:fructan beta-fructosidase